MERIWLKHYPPGVPADITDEANRYPSMASLFEESCRRHAGRRAYTSLGVHLTYRQLDESSRRFAAWLQSIGVRPGDRVALMMPNILQYPVCLFGTWRAGAVLVNTNPLYTADELHHQLVDSGAQTIVVADMFAATVQEAMPGTALRNVVVTAIGDLLGVFKGALVNLVARRRKPSPPWSLQGSISFRRALAIGRRAPFSPPALGHSDLACLQYTGGTTGIAKGAMLSHGNLVANVCQAHAWVARRLDSDDECIVTALPLYHIFALTANCLTFVKMGARNVLVMDARRVGDLVSEMKKARMTAFTGVNTLFNALLNHSGFQEVDLSRLKLALGGGMAVQQAVAERWLQATGTPIAQAYGLTETSPAVTINPLDRTVFDGSIGLPVPSTEVAIRDMQGKDLPLGESGEICVRGPQVTAGYWNRPDETRSAFDADGFFRTGDIGTMNERGYVYILDRKKDMILVSGFNVYPNEVEAAAMQHPDIKEAAAVGIPNPHSGEAVKLFVVRRRPDLTEQEVIAHCQRLLTRYKVPRQVEFRDDLPHSNVGKILRRELKG